MKRLAFGKWAVVVLLLVLTVLAACSNGGGSAQTGTPAPAGVLRAHFLDVGQADAILVELPNGQEMLVDAGNNGDADFVVDYLKNLGIEKIDYLVGTHPHEDHIGGMDAVVESFDIGQIFMPYVEHTSKTYEDVLTAIRDKGLTVTRARAGVNIFSSEDLSADILSPAKDDYGDNLNEYSAVVKISYGSTSFLLMGDADAENEADILASSAVQPTADVLKVGHHGSSYSSSEPFIELVHPHYAVISVGADNEYGHPAQQTLDRLAAVGAEVYRTDQDGTVTISSDGETISVETGGPGHPDA